MGMKPIKADMFYTCIFSASFFLSPTRFDADIHNTYTRNKIRIRDRAREEEEEKELSKELERIEKVDKELV